MTGPRAWRRAELAATPVDRDPARGGSRRAGPRPRHREGDRLPLEEVSRAHFPLDAMARRLDSVLDEIYDGAASSSSAACPWSTTRRGRRAHLLGMGRYLGAPLYQNPKGDLLGHVFHDTTRTYGDPDVRGYVSNAYLPYHTDGCDLGPPLPAAGAGGRAQQPHQLGHGVQRDRRPPRRASRDALRGLPCTSAARRCTAAPASPSGRSAVFGPRTAGELSATSGARTTAGAVRRGSDPA